MSFSVVADQVSLRFSRAPIMRKPFPWLYVRDVFPQEFYREIRANLPTEWRDTDYENRQFCLPGAFRQPFWQSLAHWMITEFSHVVASRFREDILTRFGGPCELEPDVRLVRDSQGYEILPHTDHPSKVISLLFYLPPDEALKDYGTAIYVPKDKGFRCEGTDRHPFGAFRQAYRAPFMPNTCFGFFKTDAAFHGVPAIDVPCVRDVMLFNLYEKRDGGRAKPAAAA